VVVGLWFNRRNMQIYYVILSTSDYENYEPTYFSGPRKIEKQELLSKASEFRQAMRDKWNSYPTKEIVTKNELVRLWNSDDWLFPAPLNKTHIENYETKRTVHYDPDDLNRNVYEDFPTEQKLIEMMSRWLESQGFCEVTSTATEINLSIE